MELVDDVSKPADSRGADGLLDGYNENKAFSSTSRIHSCSSSSLAVGRSLAGRAKHRLKKSIPASDSWDGSGSGGCRPEMPI